MSRPELRSVELVGATWWWTCAQFPSAYMAQSMYQALMRKIPRGDLGLYRHGEPGPSEGTFISAVSLKRDEVEHVRRRLLGGVDVELHPQLVEAMITRRARVVVESQRQHPGQSGRLKIKHAGRGAYLDPAGEMHEPGQGQG